MGAFFSSLFAEFGARRMRMRNAFGDRNASWIEFIIIGGFTLGVFAVVEGEPRGWAPLVALIPGYLLLDYSRQRALARGANEEVTRKRHDRLAFILFAALAVMGAAFCFYALQHVNDPFAPPPPGKGFDVDMVSPS